MIPWLDAKRYYRQRWGEPVGRVGIDGGFSCPNRGEDRSLPGCTFCSGVGNRPPYQTGVDDLAAQARRGMEFSRDRYGFRLFSLYFQAYTSTWAAVDELKRVYDTALNQGPFVELVVGTRPDCLPDEVADLLQSYRGPEREVWVELGLQSCHNETLQRVGRGHDVLSFQQAAQRLRSRNLPFTTHVMYGLPGEGKREFLQTVQLALDEGSSGLKLHDLLLVPGTPLHQEWQQGRFRPVDPVEYLEAVVEALDLIPPDVVVWRVCSDHEDRTKVDRATAKSSKNSFLNALTTLVRKRKGL